MLHSAKRLNGLDLIAADGSADRMDDVYFDDEKWTIRHLVVSTGRGISARTVLIPPTAVGGIDWDGGKLQLRLTRRQIEDSPAVDTAQPVSRRQEAELYSHYGYPFYWTGPDLWGYSIWPDQGEQAYLEENITRQMRQQQETDEHRQGQVSHLRSAREVIGYHIRATDGEVGHVEDFLFDDEDWAIRMIAVDTRNWWPGKHVLLAPQRILEVDWVEQRVVVDASRDELEHGPEFDPAHPVVPGVMPTREGDAGRPAGPR